MKRLACFLDGTWDEAEDETTLTNVVKLHRAACTAGGDGVTQLNHYEQGIGTKPNERGVPEALHDAKNFVEGAMGVGVDDRIQGAYRFVCENFEPGDHIFAFGFSRGAFEARSLVGLITAMGILRVNAMERLPDIWQAYRKRATPAGVGKIEALRAHTHFPTPIKCVGVWDTVGNLGGPRIGSGTPAQRFAFHDTRLSDGVEVGLHALAIDEIRGPFAPTLWTRHAGAKAPAGQIVEQVWFPGSHANVGGGLVDSALSDTALIWMAERVKATTGFTFDFSNDGVPALRPSVDGTQLDVAQGIYKASARLPFVRLIDQNLGGLPPWRRRLLKGWRTTRLPPGELSINESIHTSAIERFGHVVTIDSGAQTALRAPYRPRTLTVALQR